jgi:hypothetical protein
MVRRHHLRCHSLVSFFAVILRCHFSAPRFFSTVIFRTATSLQMVSKLPICSVCVLDRFQSKVKKREFGRDQVHSRPIKALFRMYLIRFGDGMEVANL